MLKKVFIIIVSAFTLFTIPIQAATFIYTIDTSFNGPAPVAPPPWLTATFTDTGLNQVQLDLTASGLTNPEFVGSWFFNFNPNQSVNDLLFTRLDSPPPGDPVISLGTDAFQADGGGLYDIMIDFPNSPVTDRFRSKDSASFQITSSSALDASMFDYLSTKAGQHGTWVTAARIQGGGDSRWIGTNVLAPEPTTMLVLGTTTAIAAYVKRRKNAK